MVKLILASVNELSRRQNCFGKRGQMTDGIVRSFVTIRYRFVTFFGNVAPAVAISADRASHAGCLRPFYWRTNVVREYSIDINRKPYWPNIRPFINFYLGRNNLILMLSYIRKIREFRDIERGGDS